jgi:pilus assembly protein Flp/PilA
LYLWTFLQTLKSRDEGATMVEYALLVVFIALVALAGVILVGNALNGKFGSVASTLG